MNAKIKIPQYVIFARAGNFDTADMKCFTVAKRSVFVAIIRKSRYSKI